MSLTSGAKMRAGWLKNTAKALRDPETVADEIKFIGDFPKSFATCLDETAEIIEQLILTAEH